MLYQLSYGGADLQRLALYSRVHRTVAEPFPPAPAGRYGQPDANALINAVKSSPVSRLSGG